MFGTAEGTVDQALERRRAARIVAVREHYAEDARRALHLMQMVREAEDEGDFEAAGCTSAAQWLAQASSSDFTNAQRITRTSDALRSLPALEETLATSTLTFDQVAAAAPIATPETDAQIARVAIGKPPSVISREARKIVPPTVADDQALYERRAFSMTSARGGRELIISGRLPLEQGLILKDAIWSIAKAQRTADKKNGTILDWQQSAADALVTLAQHGGDGGSGVRRSPTTLIVHRSEDAPPTLEGVGAISPETAERLTCDARRLTIQLHGRDLKQSRVTRCASYPQMRALYQRAGGHCQYPGCTADRELQGHHIIPADDGGPCELDNLILLCSRHHKHLHDHHIRISGTTEHPIFEDQSGRAITAHQPNAPPR